MSDKKIEIKQTPPIQPQLSDKAFKHMYSWEELRNRTKKSDWLYRQITEMMKRGEKGKEIQSLVEKLRESIEHLASYYKTRYLIKLGYIENQLGVEATVNESHFSEVDVIDYDPTKDLQLNSDSSIIEIEEGLVDVIDFEVPDTFYDDIKRALRSGKITRIDVSPGFGAEVFEAKDPHVPIVLPKDITIFMSTMYPEKSNENITLKMKKFKKV